MIALTGHTALQAAIAVVFAAAAGLVVAVHWFGTIADEQAISQEYLDSYADRLHQINTDLQHTRISQAATQVRIDAAHAAARVLLNKAAIAVVFAAAATGEHRLVDGATLRLINGTSPRDAFDRATGTQHPHTDTNGEPA